MNRQLKVEMVALLLYLAVIVSMDTQRGFRTAAWCVRWYANRCRDLGTWAYIRAIRADNAYRELIAP